MDSPISLLPSVGNVTPDAWVPIVQAGVTSKASVTQITKGNLPTLSVLSNMTDQQIADITNNVGSMDVTVAVQAAISNSCLGFGQKPQKLFWPAGTYLLTDHLILGSKVQMEFSAGVIINLVPPAGKIETTSLFVMSNQISIVLEGNFATINGTRAGAVVEGNACAFYLYGSDNVIIRNFNVNNFATDGITIDGDITGSGPTTNALLANLVVNNCRRNGMSIVHGESITVLSGKYMNSNGAPAGPFAGIDIEPNANQWARDIALIDVYTEGNKGGGLLFTPGAQGNVVGSAYTVSVRGGRSFHDGSVTNFPALRFASGNATNRVSGYVSVVDYLVESPYGRGVDWNNWDADLAPQVVLNNVKVINPDYTLSAVANEDRCGFVAYADAGQVVTNLGNIRMIDCVAIDNRAAPRMIGGFWIKADAGKVNKNIDIVNPSTINATVANIDVFTLGQQVANGSNRVTVSYTNGKKFQSAVDIPDFGKYGGQLMEATASITITLPTAANAIGTPYRVQTASGVNNVSITPAGADTFPGIAPHGGVIVLNDGAYLELVSLGGTAWKVVNLTGKYWLTGGYAPGRIVWASAAPTAGSWDKGDRAFNGNPAVGSPKGWICTVTGAPGTWVSEGNL